MVEWKNWQNATEPGATFCPLIPDVQPRDDYVQWAAESRGWRLILASVNGGAAVATKPGHDLAHARVNAASLLEASAAFQEAFNVLTWIGNFLRVHSAAIAGEGRAWQGDAANAFLDHVTHFGKYLERQAEAISDGSGGTHGPHSVPNRLYGAAQVLHWAQTAMYTIDTGWAAIASQNHVGGENGMVSISGTEYEKPMANQMMDVVSTLAPRYAIDLNDVLPPPPPGTTTPQPAPPPPPPTAPPPVPSPPPVPPPGAGPGPVPAPDLDLGSVPPPGLDTDVPTPGDLPPGFGSAGGADVVPPVIPPPTGAGGGTGSGGFVPPVVPPLPGSAGGSGTGLGSGVNRPVVPKPEAPGAGVGSGPGLGLGLPGSGLPGAGTPGAGTPGSGTPGSATPGAGVAPPMMPGMPGSPGAPGVGSGSGLPDAPDANGLLDGDEDNWVTGAGGGFGAPDAPGGALAGGSGLDGLRPPVVDSPVASELRGGVPAVGGPMMPGMPGSPGAPGGGNAAAPPEAPDANGLLDGDGSDWFSGADEAYLPEAPTGAFAGGGGLAGLRPVEAPSEPPAPATGDVAFLPGPPPAPAVGGSPGPRRVPASAAGDDVPAPGTFTVAGAAVIGTAAVRPAVEDRDPVERPDAAEPLHEEAAAWRYPPAVVQPPPGDVRVPVLRPDERVDTSAWDDVTDAERLTADAGPAAAEAER
ncbi:hypothetical protein Val02_72210 [Virgisporangium aliadipatigenens]|uniref:Uncharacterized protein n=1 Tax=Virgisporangium aliadipatigenens TaxID=741659 RepID=A0A8J4DTM1_9ACTN|nr:hypothetical protein [Virgisporangium aliadipatigenens]GIJ50335.1 hypothetical protein Val02_72210 [Virgisporangium aliadipatigenens]